MVSGLKEGFLKTEDTTVYLREGVRRERLEINVIYSKFQWFIHPEIGRLSITLFNQDMYCVF